MESRACLTQVGCSGEEDGEGKKKLEGSGQKEREREMGGQENQRLLEIDTLLLERNITCLEKTMLQVIIH